MKYPIVKTWVPNKEGAVFTLTLKSGAQLKIIETAGAPVAIDGLFDFDDAQLNLISGVDFIDDATFSEALAEIAADDARLSQHVRLDDIPDDSVRAYIRAAIATDILP